jgi:translation elongation factor P/translation initiation factor 5A
MASKFSRTATKHFTRPVQANTLRLGDVILLQGGHPCKIVEMKESKTGKHGGMKIHFIGLDIFTLKKCTGLIQSQSNVTLAEVRKDEMMVSYFIIQYFALHIWYFALIFTNVFFLAYRH